MRRWLSIGLALAACDAQTLGKNDGGGFVAIGEDAAVADAAPGGSAGDGGDASDAGRPPLKLRFEPIAQDAGGLRLTDIAFLPDPADEFLVTDKDGEVIHMRLEGDRARKLESFRIDETWSDSDAGLVSVVADPDFAHNRFFYVGLSISMKTNQVRRYQLVPAGDVQATKASGKVILEVTGTNANRSWHNVGSIGFTDEGYLWALFGDKVLFDPAQDVSSPLGALLRVIPSRDLSEGGYTVPPDNPYADGSGHPAVYAKGMRSPWKGLYRDGKWYFGDVGLDTTEEVNVIDMPGANFGWPVHEGPCDCADYVEPIVSFTHSSSHPFVQADADATASRLRAVYVGWLYRPVTNDPYQGRWNDVLVYGDAFTGFVRARRLDGSDDWPAGHVVFPTGWTQGPDGYVYVTALGTWPVDEPNETPSPIYRVKLDE